MMPMMLAKGASIISIIGGPFLHFRPPMRPMTPHWRKSFLTRNSLWASGLVFKTARAHDAHLGGSWGPKNASKIPPCCGDSLLERERVLERSRDGVREGPGEKRRSDDARAPGVGGIGATRCRAKALERTGSALDHGGVAGFKGLRRCRRPRPAGAAADE